MKKSHLPVFITILLTLGLAACCSDKDDEIDIEVSALPANVVEIIQNVLPGINIREAEIENPSQAVKEKLVYEVEGALPDGKEYEFEIRGDGVIIKIELEDDEK